MAGATREIPTELGTEKVGKLLKQYALPAIIAQIAASLYNMVDSIYIGHLPDGAGADAISGLAITFPLMNLSTAFGTLVGAGAATMISILLGQKHYHMGNKVLGNVVSLNIIIGLLFMVGTLAYIDPILTFFGASENTIVPARDYITIILYGNIITHLYFGLNAAMRSSGNPKKAMGLTIFTVVLNAILDPIFIFWMDMGIEGAAWATVLAQFVSMVVVLHHFNKQSRAIHFDKGIVRLNWNVAKKSLVIGTGPFLMNMAACAVTLLINQQLINCNRSYDGQVTVQMDAAADQHSNEQLAHDYFDRVVKGIPEVTGYTFTSTSALQINVDSGKVSGRYTGQIAADIRDRQASYKEYRNIKVTDSDSDAADDSIGAYGICNRIIFMFIMICMGLNQGMQPIAGYNYGARLYSRVKEVFWKTVRLAVITTTICFLIGLLIPRIACGLFTIDPTQLDIAERGMRFITLMFPIVGIQMIGTNFFQSLGLVKKSILLSLSRQILMLIPLLYALPQLVDGMEIFGITLQATDGVWLSFPISDILSTILTLILLRRLFKKFNYLHDGDAARSMDD